jgi:hypothetical protein
MRRVLVVLVSAVMLAWVIPPAAAASPPGKPGLVTAPADGSVVARWTPAKANGSAVRSYEVSFRKFLPRTKTWSRWSTAVVSGSARAKRYITKNGTDVQVRVRARNASGVGPWAGPRTQRAGVPGAVPGTRVVAGEQQATVSWSTPAPNGSAVTRYRVYRRAYVAGAWSSWTSVLVAASARSRTITGLVDGRKHQFYVRASNRWGTGTGGTIVTTTPTDVAPRAVTGLSLAKKSWSKVSLSWTNPAIPDLASVQVRRWEGTVAPTSLDVKSYVVPTSAPTASSVTDIGLVDETTYSYSVFVVDKGGKVSPPTSITVVTQKLPPPPAVAMVRSVLPEMTGALYTPENEGRGYVAFSVTAATDGEGEVTITLPPITYVEGNPYSPGALTSTFQAVQTTDPTAFGYISATNSSCRSAEIISFTPSEVPADQPITIAYDCPVGGELLLNVYPQLGWRGVNDENPQFQSPDPNDVYTFPVSAKVGGVQVSLPSPALDVVSYPVILSSVPDAINITRPLLLTELVLNGDGTGGDFSGAGFDAAGRPFTASSEFIGGVALDSSGQPMPGLTPVIGDPTSFIAGRTIQTSLTFGGCELVGCQNVIGSVTIAAQSGVLYAKETGEPIRGATFFVSAFDMGYAGGEYAARVCTSFGGTYLPLFIDRDYQWGCEGVPPGLVPDFVARARQPDVCSSTAVDLFPPIAYCVNSSLLSPK